MSEWRRGQKNKHMRTTSKKPCEICGELADHYNDGTIGRHKKYRYKKVKGIMVKTTNYSYCENKTWRKD